MIYVLLAEGFEELEAIAVVDILRRAGLPVRSVGIGGKTIAGAHDITVTADIRDCEMVVEEIEMIVLPGGMPGTKNLEKSPFVRGVIDYCVSENKYLAAICAAPSILGHLKLLREKYAVCFPGYEEELYGAMIPKDEFVCRDGFIVTAKGPGSAVDFALELVSILVEEEGAAEELRGVLQCP